MESRPAVGPSNSQFHGILRPHNQVMHGKMQPLLSFLEATEIANMHQVEVSRDRLL